MGVGVGGDQGVLLLLLLLLVLVLVLLLLLPLLLLLLLLLLLEEEEEGEEEEALPVIVTGGVVPAIDLSELSELTGIPAPIGSSVRTSTHTSTAIKE